MSAASSTREALETAAQNTIPIPVGVSGLSFLGVTFQDWVFVGTAILLLFQLIIAAPKAIKLIKSSIKSVKEVLRSDRT